MENPSTDPSTPQPSTFHGESSSSSVIPTNQMIMDDTRMNAHDAKNQQVLVELRVFSNRYDYIELDDDSDELES
ncbi:hypothetical protein Lal_00027845 [Lupinus albus]|nr:hypothetical protein Lal_00027845 [Lupinus albus]